MITRESNMSVRWNVRFPLSLWWCQWRGKHGDTCRGVTFIQGTTKYAVCASCSYLVPLYEEKEND
jgi:hypothetical protein